SPERLTVLRDRIEQTARLVRALHSRGVSHRDLKGANILTTAFPVVNCERNVGWVESSRPADSTSPRRQQWNEAEGPEDSTQPTNTAQTIANRPGPAVSATMRDVCVIDLVGVGLGRRLRRARRVQNLARLNASVGRHPALTRTDLLRF